MGVKLDVGEFGDSKSPHNFSPGALIYVASYRQRKLILALTREQALDWIIVEIQAKVGSIAVDQTDRNAARNEDLCRGVSST